jgi:HK97 family phage major capsid protein/HK97 family phage prohead protease
MSKPIDELQREIAKTPLQRTLTIERADVNEDSRTVSLAFASDTPIEHWSWRLGRFELKLSMDENAMRSERLKSGAPLLMDHNTRDQVGVIESFTLDKAEGKARANVRFSRSQRGEEVYQDVKDGIRKGVSVGFMVYEMQLETERKDQPDLYRSDDWEPYEISIVSVPADIAVGVGRSLDTRKDAVVDETGDGMCPDCDMPLDECECESAAENSERNKPTSEKTMSTEKQETPGSPVVDSAREVVEFARIIGGDKAVDLAREMVAENKNVNLDDFRLRWLEERKPSTAVPSKSPEDAARESGLQGFAPAGEVVIDKRTKEVIDETGGFGLDERQLATISSKSYRDAFRSYLRHKGNFGKMGMDAVRALSEGTDSEGGFLVPAEFMAKMVEREAASTALQSMVTNLSTGSDKLVMPKNAYSSSTLYTTGVRVNWVDEKTGPGSEEDATDFGNVTIPIHTAMMYHDVTNNMIEDSAFDILGWLSSKFRETADVVTEDSIINGTGIGRPKGILANPGGTDEPAVVVSGNGSALLADGLLDLAYALLGRYTANAKFIFNRTSTEKAIAKLKDGDNRYLFAAGVNNDGLATARPQTLLGYPILSSDFMPDVASNAFPIIFGDPKGYYLVKRIGFSVQILNEIVATSNKVRVLGRLRIGGQVAEDWRLKIQKVST